MVVELVHVQRRRDRLDVALGHGDLGLVRAAHDLRHHQRGENAEDDHHHHDFDQRETALLVHSVNLFGCKTVRPEACLRC
ncbi:hypothetical protein D3C77_747630 [compost metagenome]